MSLIAPAPIVLTTDFGLSDTFAGVMKGVIFSIAPGAKVIDLTHGIRAQDIAHAAYSLLVSAKYFPALTIFVTVIDPTVGSSRKAIAAQIGNQIFLAPDNGALSYLIDVKPIQKVVSLTNPKFHLVEKSRTFHGRDVFSPVAAHLSNGISLNELGDEINPELLIRLPSLQSTKDEEGRLRGRVIHIDSFGNVITSIRESDLIGLHLEELSVSLLFTSVYGIRDTYSQVEESEPLAYLGSDGFLELAIRNGNFAETNNVKVGDAIMVS